MKRLVVCVDDFGQNEAVDASVFTLAALGRISATGCLVDAPCWRADAPRLLAACGSRIDIGLHLNLSESFAARTAPFGWAELVAKAYTGRLDAVTMRAEVDRQLDAFEAALGRPPDFVDGHRHVHQLPTVRRALVDALLQRYPARLPWLRNTLPAEGVAGRFKAEVIGRLGARGLVKLAGRAGIAANRRMVGVYGFDGTLAEQRQRMAGWLAVAQDGDLLMCHTALPCPDPGTQAHAADQDDQAVPTASLGPTRSMDFPDRTHAIDAARAPAPVDPSDPIAPARRVEHALLAGEEFAHMLVAAKARIVRFGDLL